MLQRIYGLETEYGTAALRGRIRFLEAEQITGKILARQSRHVSSCGQYLHNGARCYRDLGGHPEYATPECADLWDLVASDRAGDEILATLAGDAEAVVRSETPFSDVEIHVVKNNHDFTGHAFGSHENYLLPRHIGFEDLDAVVPFFVTRQVFAGAGTVAVDAAGARYLLSQRAAYTDAVTASSSTRNRPVFNTRDEPHADGERWRRLHVVCGDSSMSEWANFVKVGSASLCLRILEEGYRHQVAAAELADPIAAVRLVSEDLTCSAMLPTSGGRRITALDVQEIYFAAASDLVAANGATAGERAALEEWGMVLEDLAKDPDSAADRVDWVTKKHLVERFQQRRGATLGDAAVRNLDALYHDVSARGLYRRLAAAGEVRRMVTDDAVAERIHTAPPTRAALRSQLLRAAAETGWAVTPDWSKLWLNDGAGMKVAMLDPFAVRSDEADEVLALMAAPYAAWKPFVPDVVDPDGAELLADSPSRAEMDPRLGY